MILPYSILERTKARYAFFLHGCGQWRRFLLRKSSVDFAFLHMLLIWVLHFKLSEMVGVVLNLFKDLVVDCVEVACLGFGTEKVAFLGVKLHTPVCCPFL